MPDVTTIDECVPLLRAGTHHVIMSVGPDEDDPLLCIYRDDDEHYDTYLGEDHLFTTALGGWSEGVTEAICDLRSEFIREFLDGETATLVLVEGQGIPEWR